MRRGRIADAVGAFEGADAIQYRVDGGVPYRGLGVWWADLWLELDPTREARQSAMRDLQISDEYGWWNNSAYCHWLLGRLDTLDGDFEAAAAHLRQAEATFRGGHVLIDFSGVLLGQADLSRWQGAWGDAQHKVEEALRLAASRRLLLYHADALVLRGRISLDQGQDAGDSDPVWAWRAVDDAEGALVLAQRAGYAWAERDALSCALTPPTRSATPARPTATAPTPRCSPPTSNRLTDRRQSFPQNILQASASGRQKRLSWIVGVRDRSVAQGKDPYERRRPFYDVEDPIRAHAQ